MFKSQDLTYRFEVKLRTRGWVPYTAEALGITPTELMNRHAGTHVMADVWDDPFLFGMDELDQALDEIDEASPGLAGFEGLRILVWEGQRDVGEPQVRLQRPRIGYPPLPFFPPTSHAEPTARIADPSDA